MNSLFTISGWFALVLAIAGLFLYAIVPAQTTLILGLGGAAFVLALAFVFGNREAVAKALSGRSAVYGANTAVLTIVTLGVLAFGNLLSYRHNHRFDLTEGGLFSISPQTEKILSGLTRKVKMTAFYQTDAPDRAQFQNLVESYKNLSGQLDLEFVDPDKNPAITKQFGVKTYGTVVIESGSNETKIVNPTEENLTNGIAKVIQDKKKTIYFLSGHGERPIEGAEKENYATVKTELEKEGHTVKPLLLLQSAAIPDDADVLVVAGPVKPILKQELDLIDAYLAKGGSLLFLADPQTQSGADDFLAKWGAELGDDMVIDPMSKLFGGDTAAPVIGSFADHPIAKNFALNTVMPLLRSVTPKPRDRLNAVALMKTEQNSWAEKRYKDGKVKFDAGEDIPGPVSVGVVATLDTAPENAGKEQPADSAPPSAKQARVVVIGDADFASNTYFNFSGNGDFFLNTVSWLLQAENLISIRPKQREINPVQLTQAQGSLIFMSVVIGFPGLVFIAGVRLWWKRRAL